MVRKLRTSSAQKLSRSTISLLLSKTGALIFSSFDSNKAMMFIIVIVKVTLLCLELSNSGIIIDHRSANGVNKTLNFDGVDHKYSAVRCVGFSGHTEISGGN